jgi:membrane associated rhomboid family serine protease
MINSTNQQGIKVLLSAAAFMWLIHIINMMTGNYLNQFGIFPREFSHLPGILFAPFLHGSLFHIIGNTLPFIVLGFLVHQTKQLLMVSLVVTLLGGALVWLFARGSFHIGASGLIMGYFGFLISHAYFTRTLRSILVAIAAIILYGGIIFSLLDFRAHISFEGHIFGFLAGIAAASMNRNSKAKL